jgi:hypothetical protein
MCRHVARAQLCPASSQVSGLLPGAFVAADDVVEATENVAQATEDQIYRGARGSFTSPRHRVDALQPLSWLIQKVAKSNLLARRRHLCKMSTFRGRNLRGSR